MPAKNASKHTSTANNLLSTTILRLGRLLGFDSLGLWLCSMLRRAFRHHGDGALEVLPNVGFKLDLRRN
jgi:hypothetical protein